MATVETRPDPATKPESPPPRLRERVMPRTVLGMSVLILFTALGAAFSGAVLFAYYQFQLDRNEQQVADLVDTFDEQLAGATDTISEESAKATEQIRNELEPLQRIAAGGDTLEQVLADVSPSLWFVSTLDSAGQPSVGTAFVVAADSEQTFLLTSHEVVEAATRSPAPTITVRQGDDEREATLWTWQPERDLALLIIQKGSSPRLDWADASSVRVGDRLFAFSGLGTGGGAVTQGFVADVSADGIQHDVPMGAHFRGGPLVNANGEVVGVASRAYSPIGFAPADVWFASPIRTACEKVLRCPSGDAAEGAGSQG